MKKQEPLQLQRISVFMPQRLRDDEVERLFIMRQDVFHTLLDSIKAEKTTSIPQHHLIIGQRGMGKTTLLKRLDVELRNSSLSKKFIPFTFPEEQYNIDRLSKFWLNSLDALADTLQTEGDEKMAFQLDEQIATLSVIRSEQELSQKAYELLRDSAKTLGRRPVFLLDNLNLIFDRLGEVEQSKLRKLITEPGAPIFIGASPEAFDEDLQYDAPFYDAFAVHFLYKLDFRQTLTMLRHLAEITNQTTLLSQLTADNMPRLETLHQLTGGNVRTVVILFSLVAQGFSADVFQDLEALIDQMTPLYKSRFEELAPQAQVVVDAVALNWDPCKLETLRERTSLENNQLSVQLDRLTKAGWISKLGKRKAAYYEISERFFNVWYLMRRATRRQRRDLLWLTRFLQAWFTRPELVQQAKAFMRDVHEREKVYELAYGLALARALPNQTGEKLKEKIYQRLLQLVDGDVAKLEELVGVNMDEVSEEMIRNYIISESGRLFLEGWDAQQDSNFIEAEKLYRNALRISPINDNAWHGLGFVLSETDRRVEAEDAYNKAIKINNKNDWAWLGLAFLFWDVSPIKAEMIFEEAVENVPNSERIWEMYIEFLAEQENYIKAIKVSEKAIDALPQQIIFRIDLADFLSYTNNYQKAETIYRSALVASDFWDTAVIRYNYFLRDQERETDIDNLFREALVHNNKSDNLYNWYGHYLFSKGRFQESESLYKRAIKLKKNSGYYWGRLGTLYQYGFLDYEKAEQAYRNALKLSPEDSSTKIALVSLLLNNLNEVFKAKEVFQTIGHYMYEDIMFLYQACFAAYEENIQLLTKSWKDALAKVEETIPGQTIEDWHHSAAITVRLGYGEELQAVFRETGHDRIFRPFYEAIKALTLNSEEYLKTEVAAEVRDVALQIFKFMQDYNALVSTEGANG